MMAAHTRMPGHAATAEKEAFVEDLIRRLGLSKAADSVVGDKKKRGLSGGEKKRLSIGAELIAEPVLLFTDEPTTGLDSFQAEKVRGSLLTMHASTSIGLLLFGIKYPLTFVLHPHQTTFL